MVVTLGQQYNVGEKPTVTLLYTYINHHAQPPIITHFSLNITTVVHCYEDSTNCSRVPHTTISPFLYLPFYFFATTTKCSCKRHLFPTTSAQIDFLCVLYTSGSTSAVASLSFPLCVSLFKGTSRNNIAISLPALLFFHSYNEVFVQTAFIPYFPSGTFIFRFVTTGLILKFSP